MLTRRTVLASSVAASLTLVAPAAASEVSDNKKIAKRYIDEVYNARNMAVLDEIVSPNFVPTNPDDAPGIEALKARIDQALEFNTYMVDGIAYEIDAMAGEKANVFVRGWVNGTNSSGKKISAAFFVHLVFEAGLIVGAWNLMDQTALMGI